MPDNRRFLLVVLLVLAGCNAPATGAGGGRTATLTPVAVPTADAGPPPGVADGRILDPERLARVHTRRLTAGGYAVTETTRIVGGTATLRDRRLRVRVAPNVARYRYVLRSNTTDDSALSDRYRRVDIYHGRDRTVMRVRYPNGTAASRGSEGATLAEPLLDPTWGDRIGALAESFDLRVTGTVSRDGTTLYRFEARPFQAPSGAPLWWTSGGRDVAVTLLVAESSVVRRYRLTYDATFRDERVRVTRTVRFGPLERPVDRPAWVRGSTGTVTPSTLR